MSRIVLVHWNAAEAAARAEILRAAGFEVERLAPQGGTALHCLRERPPDAFVIDLSRLPSQGKAVAIALRQQRATRSVPLVFAGGAPEKVDGARAILPDATFCEWNRVAQAVRRAIARPPQVPMVPDTMAAYSGRPLTKKLGIRADTVVALLGAPDGLARSLDPPTGRFEVRERAQGRAELVVLFARSRADLARRFPAAAKMIGDNGGLWIAWPKKTSPLAGDLTQPEVRRFGLAAGWVDYKVCAIDDTWSGLLFARRA